MAENDRRNAVNDWSEAKKRHTTDCSSYVSFAMQRVKLVPKNTGFYLQDGVLKGEHRKRITKNNKLKVYEHVNQPIKSLVKSGKVVPGDIVGPSSGAHTMIYVKHKNGRYYFHSVNGPVGQILKPSSVLNNTFRQGGNYRIGAIIHPK